MTMRTYLTIVSILLLSALSYGVYVWYVYQRVAGTQEERSTPLEEGIPTVPVPTTDVVPEEGTEKTIEEPRVLTAENLTPEQQAILKAFGMGNARIVVDDALLRCVGDAIGSERLVSITGGSAPSPLEAVKIAACL